MTIPTMDLHVANSRRADLFRQAVMTDRVMDVMLTALIVHEQGRVLSQKAAAMAKHMPIEDVAAIVADLIEAALSRSACSGCAIIFA